MSATQTSIICQSCWPSRASRTRQTAWAPSQMLTGQSLRRLSCHGLPWPALKTVLCFPPRYHHHAGIAGTTHAQMGSFLDETGCALLSGALGFRSENKPHPRSYIPEEVNAATMMTLARKRTAATQLQRSGKR